MTNAARLGRGRALRLPPAAATARATATRGVTRGVTRRQFLALTRRAAIAAALTSQARLLSACGDAARPSDAAWRELASRLSGSVLRPGDPGYLAAAVPHNLRYASILPAGVARCVSTEDVATSILWARENDIELTARSGGHSYAGYSSTRGLQIDLGAMTGAQVDASAAVARVQAGAHNSDVSAALEPFGFIMSQGRCPPVGISGLTLGGGFGFSSRKLGLTCDALLETTLVTASGEVVTCSERENPGLFWACRGGGGGNFGINTEYRFALDPASEVSVYELEWAGPDAATAVFAALQEVLASGPDELSLRLGLGVNAATREGGPTVNALGQYFGPSSELRELLAPVYAAAPPRREVIADLSFYEAKDFLATDPPPGAFEERSSYTAGPLAEQGIATLVEQLARWPGGRSGSVSAFAWGGAISRVPVDATAVVHRDTLLLLAFDAGWAESDSPDMMDASLDWLDGLFSAAQPYVLPRSYQNFTDPSLRDWQRAYYGASFERLVAVKAQVDPDDVFRFPQSIPTRP